MVKLGDVCELIARGITPKYVDSGIKVINQKCIRNFNIEYTVARNTDKNNKYNKEKFLKENDILINSTGTGTLGRVAFFKGNKKEVLVDSHVTIVRPNKEIIPSFLAYYLHLNENVLVGLGRGATNQQELNKSDLVRLKIQLPDLKTQEKIGNLLLKYYESIKNNNRRIEILEQTAEEIYKEWFVRMRFPGYKNTKSDQGIPGGWEVKKLGSLINISSSKRVYSSDYVESGVPFYRSKEVIQLSNGETISDMLYISNEKYRKFKEKFGAPQKNDILLTSVGTIGVPMLVRNNNPFYFKDGNLTWIQSSSNAKLANYLYYWLKSGAGQQQILSSTIGTSQSALTIENLKRVKVIIPEDTVLSRFNHLLSDIIESINNFTTQNQNLIRQRDLLLPRLMNGTIEVK